MNTLLYAGPPEPTYGIGSLLRAAVAAESDATGAARRSAFRTTRHLLGGCRAAGISIEYLMRELGVTDSSIRNRSSIDGLVAAETFSELAHITVDTLTEWSNRGLIPSALPNEERRTSYPASALISAFLMSLESRPAQAS